MFRLAVKSALAKKRRLFGTALSVMLGVAFLAGTLVFTDTIGRTFDDLFAGIYDDTETYVRSETSVELDQGGSQRGRMPRVGRRTVAEVSGVADAQGLVGGYAQTRRRRRQGHRQARPGRPDVRHELHRRGVEPVGAHRGQPAARIG